MTSLFFTRLLVKIRHCGARNSLEGQTFLKAIQMLNGRRFITQSFKYIFSFSNKQLGIFRSYNKCRLQIFNPFKSSRTVIAVTVTFFTRALHSYFRRINKYLDLTKCKARKRKHRLKNIKSMYSLSYMTFFSF